MSEIDKKFLHPECSVEFMDLFVVRSSILRAIKEVALPAFRGILLDVGCGVMPYRSLLTSPPSEVTRYIGMDIQSDIYQAQVDLRWDGRQIPLDRSSVDCVMATEVFEHCFEIEVVLAEIERVLRPGGVLFFTVPFLWPLHDSPYDYFRYTPYALQKLFAESGFAHCDIRPLSGFNGALAQALGLWVRRAPLLPEQRRQFGAELFNFYKSLIESDTVPSDFGNNQLSTGWTGLVYKKQSI